MFVCGAGMPDLCAYSFTLGLVDAVHEGDIAGALIGQNQLTFKTSPVVPSKVCHEPQQKCCSSLNFAHIKK